MMRGISKEELINKHPSDIAEIISEMNDREQTIAFMLLPNHLKSEVFPHFDKVEQEEILKRLGNEEIAEMLNNMAPDDRTEILEGFPDDLIKSTINLLNSKERKIALNLLGYAEDSVGRIMTPYYIQVKKEWTISRVMRHIRHYGKKAETLNFVYIVDDNQHLIDDVPMSALLLANEEDKIETLLNSEFVALKSTMKKEEAITVFEKYDRSALPVISENGVLVGILTVDDILDEITKRDTEDIQKFGGMEALELPYVDTPLYTMVRKRAFWLVILFLGEMLTASAMGYFEAEIASAVVLTLFIPLVISSGGNSGSQAATLIIRAMAIKEIGLKDWWFVLKKELMSGLLLGGILGGLGFTRIMLWQLLHIYEYGEYWPFIGLTVGLSLLGVVLWGTISGSMVPFLLKRLKLDPATSSAPMVATVVDVTGLLLYFSIAAVALSGKLL